MTVPGLPLGYSARRPTLTDAEAILAVVCAAEREALGRDDSTLGEVRELLRLPRTPPETDQWLVEIAGRSAAWGLEHALASYAGDGRRWAGLSVDTENVSGALRLYESAGMRPWMQIDAYRRRVRADGDTR